MSLGLRRCPRVFVSALRLPIATTHLDNFFCSMDQVFYMASTAVSVCLPLGVDNKEESPARQGKGRWLRYSMAAALLVVVLVCSLAYRADGARSQAVAASRRAAGKARARQLSATGQSGKASDHSAKLLHDKTHTANKAEAAAPGTYAV